MSMVLRIIASIFSVLMFSAYANAEMLTVVDTNGVVRSEQMLSDGNGSVQFSLTNKDGTPAEGVEVLLKNQVTGETLTSFSQSGSVVFDNVAPGTWIVSTTGTDIVFTTITIAPSALAGSIGGAGLSTTAMTAGGITAVAGASIAIAVSNNGSSDVMSPSS